MMMLLKAIIAFFILIYIHISYSQTPATCLEHLKTDGWPRDGVLRVEILRPGEKVPMREGAEDMSEELSMPRKTQKEGIVSIDPSSTLPEEEATDENRLKIEFQETSSKTIVMSSIEGLNESSMTSDSIEVPGNVSEQIEITISEVISSTPTALNENPSTSNDMVITDSKKVTKSQYANESIGVEEQQYEEILKQDIPEMEKLMNAVLPDDQYIVEYSLEYGFLRLSAATRQRLNIPVKVVVLDPQTDKCFGDSFSRFILAEFLGYDDLLMASVKVLAEEQDNKGYLRNVITGEHYRFVSMWWMQRGSYLASFFIMILFTISISMLLRYSHHQIFVFIGNRNFYQLQAKNLF